MTDETIINAIAEAYDDEIDDDSDLLKCVRALCAEVERETLERAAEVADGWDMPCEPRTEGEHVANRIAAAIRALKAEK